MSILLYGCTTWMLIKRMEKKLNDNYTKMFRAVLNKSWRQYPTKQQLYSQPPPIVKTIQVRRTRHVGHCWRNKDELRSDVLLWTPLHEIANIWRPARTYLQQLCADTECSLKTCRERWTEETGCERVSGRSVLAAWHHDDDIKSIINKTMIRVDYMVIEKKRFITSWANGA